MLSMSGRIVHGLVIGAVIIPSSSASQMSKRSSMVESREEAVTPARYREAWSKIGTCKQFKTGLWLLPQADRLLQRTAASRSAEKTEFESKEQFGNRIDKDLEPFIDAERVYLIHPMKGDWSKYDAEKQEMTVSFPSYTQGGTIPVGFTVKTVTTPGASYTGTNAFGASKKVKSEAQTMVQASYAFPKQVTSQPITFQLNGNDAELFKMGVGAMHILGRVIETEVRHMNSTPTLNHPIRTAYTQYEVIMKPKCAYLTFGFGPESAIAAFAYEDW